MAFFPIKTKLEIPSLKKIYRKGRQMQWDAWTDIPWDKFERWRYTPVHLEAGRKWWSLRAWMEHGAVPFGAKRLTQAIYEMAPVEVKCGIVGFIYDEFRHFQVSYMLADMLGGFIPAPDEGYFKDVIPSYHDDKAEAEISLEANLALNGIVETVSTELFKGRYRNARDPVIKEACRLIIQDEHRHVAVGWEFVKHTFPSMSRAELQKVGELFYKKLNGSLLKGVYTTVNVPPEYRKEATEFRNFASAAGLGACTEAQEVVIIRKSLADIRKRLTPYGIQLPLFKELGETG